MVRCFSDNVTIKLLLKFQWNGCQRLCVPSAHDFKNAVAKKTRLMFNKQTGWFRQNASTL